MITYGPFSFRDNLNDDEQELKNNHSVMFISDDKGNDWYVLQKEFSDNTLKIVFDENRIINSASYDVSTLFPHSFYVAEVSVIPEGFSLPVPGGVWVFDGNSITERIYTNEELMEEAEQERTMKIAAATVVIDPLKDAVELDRATEEQKVKLTVWKNYRVDLIQLDISNPLEIVWPILP